MPPDVSESANDGVEHLQVAAKEMVAAARSFLDVVDNIVADPEKMSAVSSSLTDILGGAGRSLSAIVERFDSSRDAKDPANQSNDAKSTRKPRIRKVDLD